MPMYEYTCEKCEHSFETLVFGDESVSCPECESTKLKRLMSLPSAAVAASPAGGGCGDPSLPPCGAPWCQRQGR
jgi:putative FmdB family regulatory protein